MIYVEITLYDLPINKPSDNIVIIDPEHERFFFLEKQWVKYKRRIAYILYILSLLLIKKERKTAILIEKVIISYLTENYAGCNWNNRNDCNV